jgi:hypothetical protein
MDQFTEDQGQDNNMNIRDSIFKDNKCHRAIKIDDVKNIRDKVSQLYYFDLKRHSVFCKGDFAYSNNEKIAELDYFEIDSSTVYHECPMYDYCKTNNMFDMDYFSDFEDSLGDPDELVDSMQEVETHWGGTACSVAGL